jgi:enoyl-CoA hydratase/carnithine racemase
MMTLTEWTERGVLTLELARVDRGNALNRDLQRALAEAWERYENDDNLQVAVLQGGPSVFSIGHDIAELAADPTASPLADPGFYPLHLSKPVIAAVEGPCYGLGFELALACDLRVAGEGALFGFVDPHLFVPYRVAAVLLPRMTFLGESLELILSGRILEAARMREIGLVTEVAAAGRAAESAREIAHGMLRRFAGRGDFRKQAIWGLSGLPLPAAMRSARSPR